MADYWKSNPKKYCEVCKCWIQDNAISINNHESGQRHINNVKKRLEEIRKNANADSKGKMKEKISLICDMAFVGMMEDIKRDPALAKRYGVDISVEQIEKMNAERRKTEGKKPEKVKKNDKKEKTAVPGPSFPQPVTKPIVYEWQEFKTADGRVYYHNKKTGITQWERPQGSIQPVNDLFCVAKERKRLDQFVFNRLVELSESGVAEASAAVCQAFGASDEKTETGSGAATVLREQEDSSRKRPAALDEMPVEFRRGKLPRVNLLPEWEPVVEEKPVAKAVAHTPAPVPTPSVPPPVIADHPIKVRIQTMATKTFKATGKKLADITEKAELLSHLSDVNEADIFSDYNIKFQERKAHVSATAIKATHKLESALKQDTSEACAKPPIAITFKKRNNANRSIRTRTSD